MSAGGRKYPSRPRHYAPDPGPAHPDGGPLLWLALVAAAVIAVVLLVLATHSMPWEWL